MADEITGSDTIPNDPRIVDLSCYCSSQEKRTRDHLTAGYNTPYTDYRPLRLRGQINFLIHRVGEFYDLELLNISCWDCHNNWIAAGPENQYLTYVPFHHLLCLTPSLTGGQSVSLSEGVQGVSSQPWGMAGGVARGVPNHLKLRHLLRLVDRTASDAARLYALNHITQKVYKGDLALHNTVRRTLPMDPLSSLAAHCSLPPPSSLPSSTLPPSSPSHSLGGMAQSPSGWTPAATSVWTSTLTVSMCSVEGHSSRGQRSSLDGRGHM